MTSKLKVVVTGASGFIAKNLRQYLSDNNINLVSVSRNNFSIFKGESKIVSKNYDNLPLSKIKNFDALIHLIGIGKQTVSNDYVSINTKLTTKIVDLCKKAKIKKIIYLSGLGVSAKTTLGYFISKYNAEQEIIFSGLDYTIFRPSYIVGGNDYLTKYLHKQIKYGVIEIPGSGKYCIQPISVIDVSKVILQAINQKKFRKKILDLVGPELITFEKYVKLFSKNHKVKIQKIGLEKAYFKAISNPKTQFGIDDLNILVGNFKGNYKTLEKISKIKFQSINDILKTCSPS